MTTSSIGLILVSCFLHVLWNALIKSSSDKDLAGWAVQVGASLLAFAMAGVQGANFTIPLNGWLFAAATGVVYAVYYTLLAGAYRHADLSTAYPLVRGSAPAFAFVIGVAALGERPLLLEWLGLALVCLSVMATAERRAELVQGRKPAFGLMLALLAGLASAIYLAIDKQGIQIVAPTVYIGLAFGFGAVFQLPIVVRRMRKTKVWPDSRTIARWGLASVACMAGYALLLAVLRSNPVSSVTALRALSVPMGVWAGGAALSEGHSWRKWLSAFLGVGGMVLFALAAP